MTIGLLGGSFDPAHEGHAHLTREALKRLDLDRIWWLVSPGNPLKPNPPAPMAERIARAKAVMARPGTRLEGRGSRAAEEYARYRLPAEAAKRLAAARPPAWVFLDMPLNDLSSSAIRARGEWRSSRQAKTGQGS